MAGASGAPLHSWTISLLVKLPPWRAHCPGPCDVAPEHKSTSCEAFSLSFERNFASLTHSSAILLYIAFEHRRAACLGEKLLTAELKHSNAAEPCDA